MGRIQLLDCTLRDGGYVNDWNFGHNNLISIFERLVNARIDIVEVGFIDERRSSTSIEVSFLIPEALKKYMVNVTIKILWL